MRTMRDSLTWRSGDEHMGPSGLAELEQLHVESNTDVCCAHYKRRRLGGCKHVGPSRVAIHGLGLLV